MSNGLRIAVLVTVVAILLWCVGRVLVTLADLRRTQRRVSALVSLDLESLSEQSVGDEAAAADAERRVLELLDELEDLVRRAKAMPISHEVRVKRDDVYDILDRMRLEIVNFRDGRALIVLQLIDQLDDRVHRARGVPFSFARVRVKREVLTDSVREMRAAVGRVGEDPWPDWLRLSGEGTDIQAS